jgi:hypothetical protein
MFKGGIALFAWSKTITLIKLYQKNEKILNIKNSLLRARNAIRILRCHKRAKSCSIHR